MKLLEVRNMRTGKVQQMTEQNYNSLIGHYLGKGLFKVVGTVEDVPAKAAIQKAAEALAEFADETALETQPVKADKKSK
jgi:hypothetical protein